ncbi:MAG: sugar phosphate isomerase/epimerase [Defluviitaleaceae bacterium]|nr:sugar phosphate isomerase/epimerase [Defluviitaleaceae bacterium]MCL2275223.1 sugar phosphate isomerase/epimerase [Defluviitaleaceae bacterium]
MKNTKFVLGARAHDFGRHTADALASLIKKNGFDCVQLAPAKAIEGINAIGEINDRHLEEIRTAFTKHDLEIAVLGCYIDPALTDETQRLANVRLFCDNLHHAQKLGVKYVGTETTGFPADGTHEAREKQYALLKDSVLRMAEVAEKTGVSIGIEPVADHTLNSPELTRRLLDEVNSPRLKLIFDPANMLLPATVDKYDAIFDEMIRLNGEEISVMHIKGITIEDGKKVWANIHRSAFSYENIFTWLKAEKSGIRLLCDEVRMDSFMEDLNSLKELAGI